MKALHEIEFPLADAKEQHDDSIGDSASGSTHGKSEENFNGNSGSGIGTCDCKLCYFLTTHSPSCSYRRRAHPLRWNYASTFRKSADVKGRSFF